MIPQNLLFSMQTDALKNLKMIQWNCRGIRGKIMEIESMLKSFDVDIFVLSETLLESTSEFYFNGYQIFRKERVSCTGGGVMIMVKNGIVCQDLNVLSDAVEIIGVQVQLKNFKVNIGSIYITNNIEESVLDDVLCQLPKPHVLAGDFNAHSQAWGSYKEDARGKTVLEFLSCNELVFLNNGSITRKACPPKRSSAIDLTLVSTDISLIINWEVLELPTQSDHYPICSEFMLDNELIPTRKFDNLCFPTFLKNLEQITSNNEPFDNVDDEYQNIIKLIDQAVEISKKRKTSNKRVHRNYWWDDECQLLWNEAKEMVNIHR